MRLLGPSLSYKVDLLSQPSFSVNSEYFGQEIQRENTHVLQKRICYDEITCLEDSLKTSIKEMLDLRTKAW